MANSQPLTQSNHLFSLIEERLSLMPQVAHYKFVHQQAIFVPAVEQKILAVVANDARLAGVDVAKMQAAMQLQMQIGVNVQKAWTHEWQTGRKPNQPPKDLDSTVRPALAKITYEIVVQTANAKTELADPANEAALSALIRERIQARFVTEPEKQSLLQSLLDVAKV